MDYISPNLLIRAYYLGRQKVLERAVRNGPKPKTLVRVRVAFAASRPQERLSLPVVNANPDEGNTEHAIFELNLPIESLIKANRITPLGVCVSLREEM